MSGQRIVEGVFAIHKPPSLSSAQVIRELQHAFNNSALFKPWIKSQEAFRAEEHARNPYQRRRRRNKRVEVKVGHGGTLDPLATGVLIVGVGKGTKALPQFLECTKSYETSVLFGASTDTYDISGRILARAEYKHVTKEKVEGALDTFRGNIVQQPPLYSALRVQGKKLYEYAREGLEVPAEIVGRPMKVDELRLVQWLEGGEHDVRWPIEEAQSEEKAIAKDLLGVETESGASPPSKRKRGLDPGEDEEPVSPSQRKAAKLENEGAPPNASSAVEPKQNSTPELKDWESVEESKEMMLPDDASGQPLHPKRKLHFHDNLPPDTSPKADAPVAKVSMIVSSGFYVRSFCHDLGRAVGSAGLMATLVRSRQAEFELGKNVLDFEDFSKGEDVWGPKVAAMLDDWNTKEEDREN